MRNPFRLKNILEHDEREVGAQDTGIDFEESILDREAHDRLERHAETETNVKILWPIIVLVFALVSLRLFYLTVLKHEDFRAIAEGNRLRIDYLPAPRGAVYDRNGEAIVANKPSFEVVVAPLDLPKEEAERDQVFGEAARILGMDPAEIKSLVLLEDKDLFQSVLIKQNVQKEEALILEEQSRNLPGFQVVNTPIRDYKQASAFAHVIGYVGKITREEYQEQKDQGYLYNDSLGKTGLEQIYEPYLRGTFGQRQVEVDARGKVQKVFGEKQSLAGADLHLNLDAGLQETLYSSLSRRLNSLGRKKAAGIVMDPRDGRILALASLPSYDNNLFAQGISQAEFASLEADKNQPLFNRSIRGVYPPGSTVKPMVAAAALAEQVVTARTMIEDRGYIVIENVFGGPDYFFYGYDRQGLGLMDVRRAIALSSDIYFYVVGGGYEPVGIQGLGIEKIADYYRRFAIDQTLGIDLPGEKAGLVPTPEWKQQYFADDPITSRWYLGDTYHVSIGQGDLLATPLHVLSWTSAIANGGKIYRPFLVDRILDQEGKELESFHPEIIGEIGIDGQYLQIVREGMRAVVTDGTAKSLSSVSIAAAGKTGTAQFDARNPYRTHAWFTGFAPYENPEIAIVVLIEDGGEGSTAAVPVAREVLDWWARNRYQK